ncbi:hypothetical protein ACJ41O_011060 [Fusarium nematophilum]
MLERIRSLKESTFDVCTAINAHLKSSTSSHRSDLKQLVVELRLLGGSLYSLEELITELLDDGSEADAGGEAEWPLIDGCEMLITALKSFHSFATPDGLRAARTSLLDTRSKLAFILGSSESIQDIALQFSILGSDSIPQLMTRKEDPERAEAPAVIHVRDEKEPGPEDVSAWLTLLNSSENDREPAEYKKEVVLLQSRRVTEPNYKKAATQWPKYAEKYWQKLRPQVCSLFRIQGPYSNFRHYNFVQWVLEYARETFPRTLGSSALSPRLLLELTDALCDGPKSEGEAGSVSPLHIAAALSLPSLCRDLISMGVAHINQPSLLGTPLFCALVGPKVLVTRTEPDSWSSLLVGGDSNVDLAATVLLLLDEGADCSYRFHWKNTNTDEPVSLAGLAFWVALTTKYEAIFTRIVSQGGWLDGAFLQFLQRDTLVMRGMLHRDRFARLLTYVYDLTLDRVVPLLDPKHQATITDLKSTLSQLMKHAKLKFAFSKDGKIPTLDDDRLPQVIRAAVLDFDATLVERLTSDPRFDPNLLYDKRGTGGTILHMATEGSQLEIMDILIRAGADVRARDSRGCTPVMVVEETEALDKLILQHGASTVDEDNEGHTIWHLAANTNDVKLLKWLAENDPCKEQNLAAVCRDSLTPLMASFAYIRALETLPKGSRAIAPLAARFLLDICCHKHLDARNNHQLAHWAIQWGNPHLLAKIFEAIPEANEDDPTLLQYLNMSASGDIVTMVLDKCQGRGQVSFPLGTAAETVITNTKLIRGRSGFARPTAHPSCFPSMTGNDYAKLLTPEVLKSRDRRGRGLWARFCDDILTLLAGPSAQHPSYLHFLSAFICMALGYLVEYGVLADYEQETGEWAIVYMADRIEGRPSWQPWQMRFITAVLEVSGPRGSKDAADDGSGSGTSQMPNKFLQSFDAALLLREAVRLRQPRLIRALVNAGVQIHTPWEGFYDQSLLEYVISANSMDIELMSALLENSKPQQLIDRQFNIFDKIMHMPNELEAADFMGQLIAWGMDPDLAPKPRPTTKPGGGLQQLLLPEKAMLPEAISQDRADIASVLLEYGADPAFGGSDGYNALLAVAEAGNVIILEEIIERVDPEFDWLCIYEGPGVSYNALQIAADNGRHDVLELLLSSTPLAEEIDSVTKKNGMSPAHLAARGGYLECVKTLSRYGAELEAKDSSGRTPLFWAIMGGKEDVVEYLKDTLMDPGSKEEHAISLLGHWSPKLGSEVRETVSRPPDGDAPEASRAPKESESRRLGAMIADMISRHRASSGGLFTPLLKHVSKEELEAAILPCDGCTLLSYTAAWSLMSPMLELLDLGFGGFVTGCSKHWPSGYNALLHGCLQIQKLLQFNIFIPPEEVYSFFSRCLDIYLAEGRLWFHLPFPPLYAICQYRHTVGGTKCEHQERVLQIFIDHLVAHADEYWSLVVESGLSGLSSSTSDGDTKARILHFVLNLRSQIHMGGVYQGGHCPTALHILVDSCGKRNFRAEPMEPVYNMARMLLSNGADVNARDTELVTPLHLASCHAIVPLITILLEAGADPNARDSEGTTPLGQAAASGEIDAVRCLLEHGADPSTFDGLGFLDAGSDLGFMHQLLSLGMDPYTTALGRPSVASLLLSCDARPFVLNGNFDFYQLAEQDPSFLGKAVVRTCSPMALKAVLRRIPKEHLPLVVNFDPQTSLSAGCLIMRIEDEGLLEQLLDFGFDFEKECCEFGSALMFAASIGAAKSFKILIRRGARPAYVATDARGRRVVRSVVEATRVYPKLLEWLLVGRHYETRYIEWEAHSAPFTATKPWSGPRRAAYRLVGNRMQHSWQLGESSMEYLKRVRRVRKTLAGKIVPVTLVE